MDTPEQKELTAQPPEETVFVTDEEAEAASEAVLARYRAVYEVLAQ